MIRSKSCSTSEKGNFVLSYRRVDLEKDSVSNFIRTNDEKTNFKVDSLLNTKSELAENKLANIQEDCIQSHDM